MRITRSSLLSLARDMALLRFKQEPDLMCIYMTGSMRLENPLLGGATDIDLIFVHAKDPLEPREIQKISDDVTLDIAHLGQSVFQQPRHLRLDPWIGSFLCEDPLVLQQHQHWFDFTQAAVCAQFYAPETVLARVKPLAENARRLWFSLQSIESTLRQENVRVYLKAVEDAVNALACLYGPPLTDRRFLVDFSTLAERIENPTFSTLANSLVNHRPLPEEFWPAWIPVWKEALSIPKDEVSCPKKLQPARLPYYLKACEALYPDNPSAAMWIMLRTWSFVPPESDQLKGWNEFCGQIGFDSSGFSSRLEALDQFLDLSEEWIENWARYNGL